MQTFFFPCFFQNIFNYKENKSKLVDKLDLLIISYPQLQRQSSASLTMTMIIAF